MEDILSCDPFIICDILAFSGSIDNSLQKKKAGKVWNASTVS